MLQRCNKFGTSVKGKGKACIQNKGSKRGKERGREGERRQGGQCGMWHVAKTPIMAMRAHDNCTLHYPLLSLPNGSKFSMHIYCCLFFYTIYLILSFSRSLSVCPPMCVNFYFTAQLTSPFVYDKWQKGSLGRSVFYSIFLSTFPSLPLPLTLPFSSALLFL